jgi:hypothetical protein
MTAPSSPPAWATVDDLPSAVAELHPPARWEQFLETATVVLWAATGRRWRGDTAAAEAVLRAAPPRGGSWAYDRSWGHCACWGGLSPSGAPRWASSSAYRHESPTRVRLPHPDVTAVASVTVDGAAFTAWELDGAWLTRTDGEGWPMCGDRVVIAYEHGKPPPAAGVAAVVELAVELGRADADEPDRPCSLPKRLLSVTRQGLTFDQAPELDRFEFLDKGRTGLYAVDAFIAAVNPKGRPQPGRVWSPEIPRARRRS